MSKVLLVIDSSDDEEHVLLGNESSAEERLKKLLSSTETLSEEGQRLLATSDPTLLRQTLDTILDSVSMTNININSLVDFLSNIQNKEIFSIQGRLGDACLTSSSFVRLLDPKIWIDDDLVTAVGLLLESSEPKLGFLPSYFWTGQRPLFKKPATPQDFNWIAAPLVVKSHWVLLVAFPQEGRIRFYNSYHNTWKSYQDEIDGLSERFGIFKAELEAMCPNVKWKRFPTDVKKYPKQFDSQTCGLYVLYTIQLLISGQTEAMKTHS